jgi:hypothetical protein
MIAQFAWRLICGMSLMWALMPRKQVTSGFFRIQMLVVMGLGVLAAMSDAMDAQSAIREAGSTDLVAALPSPIMASLPAILVAFLGFLGSAFWTLERRIGAARIGFGILALSALWIWMLCDSGAGHDGYSLLISDTMIKRGAPLVTPGCSSLIAFSSEFIGAAVLGSSVVGMLLGHWYLTTPTMSIEPLKRLNLFLGFAGAIRLFVSAFVVVMLCNGAFDSTEKSLNLASIPLAWLFLRWLAGIAGPIAMSLMVWRILKYRNTQAATGVLFVGVILSFIGDMTAALLLQETKLPL